MTGAVLPFPTIPRRLCAMCGRQATRTIDLVDEDNQPAGHKFLCEEYPHCMTPGVVEPD